MDTLSFPSISPTHIIIIGNGFDLNQEIKTSYTDFINSSYFSNCQGGNALAVWLKTKHQIKNWIDLENELKNYSKEGNILPNVIGFQKNFKAISNALKEYLKSLHYDNLKKETHSYKLI